jgi:hypothetical protein
MLPISTTTPLPALAAAVLTWIGEGGLASAEQLARRFWPPARPRSAYRYLLPLVQAGYLATAPQTILGRGRTVYALTAAGSAALGLAPPLVRVGWPHPQELPHLLLGREMRLLLEARLAQAGQGGRILAWAHRLPAASPGPSRCGPGAPRHPGRVLP